MAQSSSLKKYKTRKIPGRPSPQRTPEGLTPRQEAFCREYIVDLNATKAYQRAGFKGNANVAGVHAHVLLRQPKIQAQVRKEIQKRERRTRLSQDLVIQKLRDNAENAAEAEDWGASNQAWKLIGMHLGMFLDKNINISGHIAIEAMTHEQRLARLAELVELARGRRLAIPHAGGTQGIRRADDASVVEAVPEQAAGDGVQQPGR
jgi:phage terminase small subunit